MSTTTIRRPAATGRRTLGALRALLAPVRRPSGAKGVALADTLSPVAEQHVEQLADVFAADELPALADIAAAAEKFLDATEQARTADRTKRAAKKLLEKVPSGIHGMWHIERVDNAREVADLEAIRAIFTAHDLGEVPMKPCAPSLKVAIVPELAQLAGLVAA